MISGKVDIFIFRETLDEMERNDKINWYLVNIKYNIYMQNVNQSSKEYNYFY